MKKPLVLATIAVLTTVVQALSAHADTVGPVLLTPDGPNTSFQLTGVFNAGTPATAYSSPNGAWTLSFELPTMPTDEAFAVPDLGIFGIDTTVNLNGTSFPDSQVVFFSVGQQGGVTICLSMDCNPGFPPAASFFDIFTVDAGNNYVQLYEGDVTAPTFLAGSFPVDGSQSVVTIASVPEPTSLTLLGTGAVALGALVRRRIS